MSEPLRIAGWGSLPDGASVTWTISEGRRGRRWRESVAVGSTLRHALLLETDPDGRFSHLELAAATGLWTFHPEGDGTLHGNHVDPTGAAVRHVVGWPFDGDALLLVDGSPIAASAAAWWLATTVAADGRSTRAAVGVDPAAGTTEALEALEIERHGADAWRLGRSPVFGVDPRGAPMLSDGRVEALEADPESAEPTVVDGLWTTHTRNADVP